MENASKALIIAGAILISILLISIGVILVNSANGLTAEGESSMDDSVIKSFNGKWTRYSGQISGSELKALESAVRASNVNNEAHSMTVRTTIPANGANSAASLANLVDSRKYNVSLSYAERDNNGATRANMPGTRTFVGPDAATTEPGYIFAILIQP